MTKRTQKSISFIFGAMVLVWLFGATAAAQCGDDIGVCQPLRKKAKPKPVSSGGGGGGGGGGNTRRSSRNIPRQQITKVVTREITKNVSVVTSNLSVTTQPFAVVTLSPLGGGTPKKQTADAEGNIVFQNLTPAAQFNVSADLDGFNPLKTDEPVKIVAKKTIGINLLLEPVTYDLRIKFNITDGEVRYAPVDIIRETSEGIVTKEKKGYCVVKVEGGEAVIPKLQKGDYKIIVYPSAIEYQSTGAVVKVPDDILDEDEEGKLEKYELDLEKRKSTEQFTTAWTSNEWGLPAGWNLQNKIQNNGLAGIALPRSELYRYYVDFELMTNINLLNDDTVGFVFRAEDANNYYLVQLSGARAAEPYRVKGFRVSKGVATQIFTNPIEHLAEIMKKQFTFIVRSEGNKFKLFIQDSSTGDDRELGNMVDPLNVLKKGAVGIAGNANSRFEVVSFTVLCKGDCR